MKYVITFIIFVLLAIYAASPANAHNDGLLPDKNGNGVVTVFKAREVGNLHGEWREYMLKANRQLRERVPSAPRLKRVFNRDRADVIIIREPSWSTCAGQFNRDSNNRFHYIKVGGSCTPGARWFSHEMGHGYGEQHHDCTPFWKKRTASVAGLNDVTGALESGCAVEINGFGPHDIEFLRKAMREDRQ